MRWALNLLLLLPWPLAGQAVTQGRSSQGLPWAVVELPGGDTEILAAWLPPEAALPTGWEEGKASWPRVVVKEELAATGLGALLEGVDLLPQAVAVVLVGPLSRRELTGVLAKLDLLKPSLPPPSDCSFADGVVSVFRADREGFALTVPAPRPESPLWELTEMAAFVAERRWRRLGFAGPVRWQAGPCAFLRLEDEGSGPRRRLALGREALRQLALPVQQEELEAYSAWKLREAAQWTVAPRLVAEAACLRVAWGRALGTVFVPPAVGLEAASELMFELFGRVRGRGEVFERERRAVAPARETLANGVTLLSQESSAEVGFLAVGFSGVGSQAASEAARALAVAAAKEGLPAETVFWAGMAAAVVVARPSELTEQLERLVGLVSEKRAPGNQLIAQGLQSLGVTSEIHAENMAVLLQLPEGEEELLEAAHKFLGSVVGAPVGRLVLLAPGLSWTVEDSPAQVAAFVDLPETPLAAALGQVLVERLLAQGVQAHLVHTPGRMILSFSGKGATSVSEQDSALKHAWDRARLLTGEEVLAAWPRFVRELSGSAARASMRQVLSVFLPWLSAVFTIHPKQEEAVNLVQGLPAYSQLPRLGLGPTLARQPSAGKGDSLWRQ